MPKESSSFQFIDTPMNNKDEANENSFKNSISSAYFPPSRSPFNAITDPCQYQKESPKSESDFAPKFEGAGASKSPNGRTEAFCFGKGINNAKCNDGTARVYSQEKPRCEAGQVQSTNAKGLPKRLRYAGTKKDSTSEVSRKMTTAMPEPSLDVPHSELLEDSSFFTNHNVQVIIRIRPLGPSDRAAAGPNRCLRREGANTIVWLGHPETRFRFDNIACETTSQEELFRVAGLPMVECCMAGYNSFVFTCGQAGSGKTYTMMGGLPNMEGKINENSGITQRVFEHLFARIRAEEEDQRKQKLKIYCKCSFIEILNDQIKDLLEPSSSNLQLREDLKKGLHVENLTEHNVSTVKDVLKLLSQGASNKRKAATHLNSESNESRCVFTCIIERQLEKDSMTRSEFARFNLVDLAGFESQKTSGAEGDYLKDAATLSWVIMSLVDGKHKHVLQRDHGLAFLLKGLLDGNSKTTIIANISPSICSANETLSTLNFAQRAKFLQNNVENNRCKEILSSNAMLENEKMVNLGSHPSKNCSLQEEKKKLVKGRRGDLPRIDFQSNVDRLTKDQPAQSSHQRHIDLTREQAELETNKKILLLQEEDAVLELGYHENLLHMAEENMRLRRAMKANDDELRALSMDWEKETLELTGFLLNGSKYLKEATDQIESDSCSFTQENVQVAKHVGRVAKVCLEKDETIVKLQKSLEDAQNMVPEMEFLLSSLKEATMAFAEIGNHNILNTNLDTEYAFVAEGIRYPFNLAREGGLESEAVVEASFADMEMYLLEIRAHICEALSIHLQLVQDLVNEINEKKKKKKKCMELVGNDTRVKFTIADPLSVEAQRLSEVKVHELSLVENELAETNEKLNSIQACIETVLKSHSHCTMAEDLVLADGLKHDCSVPPTALSVFEKSGLEEFLSAFCSKYLEKTYEKERGLKVEQGYSFLLDKIPPQNSDMVKIILSCDKLTVFCLWKELQMASIVLNQAIVHLSTIFNATNCGNYSHEKAQMEFHQTFLETKQAPTALESRMVQTEADSLSCLETGSALDADGEFKSATEREADIMLNALFKANEKAESLSAIWRQVSEKLMLEKAGLVAEVEELKSMICVKEKENDFLLYQIHFTVKEMTSQVSLLEESLVQIQRDAEEEFREICSSGLLIGLHALHSISSSRSSMEDICASVVEKGIALFVLYLWHSAELSGKKPNYHEDPKLLHCRQQGCQINSVESIEGEDQGTIVKREQKGEEILVCENQSLRNELGRKDSLMNGLLFDLSMLQESASKMKDIKDESGNLMRTLSRVQHELENKTSQIDELFLQCVHLEVHLADVETTLFNSSFDLQQAKRKIDSLTNQNSELRVLLKETFLEKTEAGEQLDEQEKVMKGLQKEILHLKSSIEKNCLSSIEDTVNDLRTTNERNMLLEEVGTLNDRLEKAYALADKNEAIAVEARQELEVSKSYAEQKEEEAKILESCVEELEITVNLMEKKVSEMEEEVKTHQLARDSIELEAQALRQRLSSVENLIENIDFENPYVQMDGPIPRKLQRKLLELDEANNRIKVLEDEQTEQAEEMKQSKDYISELLLHAEAQASLYQEKYKTLEAKLQEVKANLSMTSTATPALVEVETSSTKGKGSNSLFRCIEGMIQQMEMEKNQELSTSRLRIQELESLVDSQQKEVWLLNTRLAATESMTHDVIRDLLGVKYDVTNYANLIDQVEVQKLLKAAQQQTEESQTKEQEIKMLMRQVNNLNQEKGSFILEKHKRDADLLDAQMTIQELEERNVALAAENEALKDLKLSFVGGADRRKRVAGSENLLRHVKGDLSRYRAGGSRPPEKNGRQSLGNKMQKKQGI